LFRNFLSEDVKTSRKIKLPVAVGSFTWFGGKNTPVLYALVRWSPNTTNVNYEVDLYNADGEVVGLMGRPEFIETSVGAFLRHLNPSKRKKTRLPEMWEALWRPSQTNNEIPIDLSSLVLPSSSSPEVVTTKLEIASTAPDLVLTHFKSEVNKIFIHVLLRASTECNWGLALGGKFSASHIRKFLPPKLQPLKILEFWIQVLIREGYVEAIDGPDSSEFRVIRHIPDVSECNQAISSIIAAVEANQSPVDAMISFGKRVAEKYTDVLQGKMENLELLFPTDGAAFGAARLYNECKTPTILSCFYYKKTIRHHRAGPIYNSSTKFHNLIFNSSISLSM